MDELNFSQIQPLTAELAALECLKKIIFSVLATVAPSISIGSSSFVEVTRTFITSRMSSNFSQTVLVDSQVSDRCPWDTCCLAYEKRMHNVLPTYEQRLPGALGTYAAYVKRVKNVLSVRDFIYK